MSRLSDFVTNLKVGISYVRATRPVLAVFGLVVAHCALTMSFDAMLPGFAETELHKPKGAFTLMTFGIGIGALISTLWLSLKPGFHRGEVLFYTSLVSGVSPMLMAASMNIPSAVASCVLMGSSQALFMAVTSIMLQQVIPDNVRGRVMSLHLMSAGGVMAFANLGFGSLADSP